jgi:hypothetical protein
MGNEWKSSTTCEIKCIFTNFNLFEIKACSVDKHNRSKPEHAKDSTFMTVL